MITLRIALAAGVVSLLVSVPFEALCLDAPLDRHFARSSLVFVGRAVAQEFETPENVRPWYTVTTFEVEEAWKRTDRIVKVRTRGASNGAIGYFAAESFHFRIGSRYVVFAGGEKHETSACDATAGIDEPSIRASMALTWLADKRRTLPR
jgi:hypothetical protein